MNALPNDGSFMELMLKKLEEEKAAGEDGEKAATAADVVAAASGK
jgi:hypothetical protein